MVGLTLSRSLERFSVILFPWRRLAEMRDGAVLPRPENLG
jgi:hypothetical protein